MELITWISVCALCLGIGALLAGLAGRITDRHALFCTRCGYEVQPQHLICTECGNQLVLSSRSIALSMSHPGIARFLVPAAWGRRVPRPALLRAGSILCLIGGLQLGAVAWASSRGLNVNTFRPTSSLLASLESAEAFPGAIPIFTELQRRNAEGVLTQSEAETLAALELHVRELQHAQHEPELLISLYEAESDPVEAELMRRALYRQRERGMLTISQTERLLEIEAAGAPSSSMLASAQASAPAPRPRVAPAGALAAPARDARAPDSDAITFTLPLPGRAAQEPSESLVTFALARDQRGDEAADEEVSGFIAPALRRGVRTVSLGDEIVMPEGESPLRRMSPAQLARLHGLAHDSELGSGPRISSFRDLDRSIMELSRRSLGSSARWLSALDAPAPTRAMPLRRAPTRAAPTRVPPRGPFTISKRIEPKRAR